MVDSRDRVVGSTEDRESWGELLRRALGSRVADLVFDPARTRGSTALYYAGTWRATGEPVWVKLGVSSQERYWTREIARVQPGIVATVYDEGEELGDLSVGWMIVERVPYGPLGAPWQGREVGMLIEAGVRFQAASRQVPIRHIRVVGAHQVEGWIRQALRRAPPGPVHRLLARLPHDLEYARSVCEPEPCHGDLRLCNGLSRKPPPQSDGVVLVNARPVMQPWCLEAAHLQISCQVEGRRASDGDVIGQMARLRAAHGLRVYARQDLQRLSHIVLAWMALREWGRRPHGWAGGDYREETARYVSEAAALA